MLKSFVNCKVTYKTRQSIPFNHSLGVYTIIPVLLVQIISQSPLIFACLKYFMPTHAVTTQTQAMIHVRIIRLG